MFQCKLIASLEQLPQVKIVGQTEMAAHDTPIFEPLNHDYGSGVF